MWKSSPLSQSLREYGGSWAARFPERSTFLVQNVNRTFRCNKAAARSHFGPAGVSAWRRLKSHQRLSEPLLLLSVCSKSAEAAEEEEVRSPLLLRALMKVLKKREKATPNLLEPSAEEQLASFHPSAPPGSRGASPGFIRPNQYSFSITANRLRGAEGLQQKSSWSRKKHSELKRFRREAVQSHVFLWEETKTIDEKNKILIKTSRLYHTE